MKNRLKALRMEKGLTQEELGNQLGLANNTISRYETGSNEPLKLRIAEMQLNAVATAYKKTIHFDFGNLKKEYGGLDEHNR